jgi:hypothetical protein
LLRLKLEGGDAGDDVARPFGQRAAGAREDRTAFHDVDESDSEVLGQRPDLERDGGRSDAEFFGRSCEVGDFGEPDEGRKLRVRDRHLRLPVRLAPA